MTLWWWLRFVCRDGGDSDVRLEGKDDRRKDDWRIKNKSSQLAQTHKNMYRCCLMSAYRWVRPGVECHQCTMIGVCRAQDFDLSDLEMLYK